MLIVTGGIACGKSTFTNVARELGLVCIDADEWYKDIYLNSQEYRDIFAEFFYPEDLLYKLAFKHKNWESYLYEVRESFYSYILSDTLPDILILENIKSLPDKLKHYFILMISRENNYTYALERDNRDIELTALIYKSQLSELARVVLSDFVIYNIGTKQQFEEDCRIWLKSHLQEALTHHMKDINT